MKDLVLERLCEPWSDFVYERRAGHSLRCEVCKAAPTNLWSSWQHVFEIFGRARIVITCCSHYCRSRAREAA